jgi:hypothetical protein
MFSINDNQIDFAERSLLPIGGIFDSQRRDVIKYLESKNILACPGSGKTTALLAKLLIISDQLPFKDNKGICVLTHTNVAIDTITQKMDSSAGKLLNYPNHFGTIQSFVDKYLAIPAYIDRFGRRPNIIDNDWYNTKVDKQFKYLPREAKHLCHKNKRKGYPNTILFSDLEVSEANRCKKLSLDLNLEKDKRVYDGFVKLKERVLEFGVLSYDDAYYLASTYLSDHPSLPSLFSNRFAFVFIDEMQDTDSKQLELIDSLFNDSVVFQRIGDINQSIFSFGTPEEECAWIIPEGHDVLEITGSKRFSNAIANVIAPVSVNPQLLIGNPQVPDISPTMIAFSDNNIEQVIPRFGDLVFEQQLHMEAKQCFKVVGCTGKSHDTKHTIPSYWTSFQKEIHTKSIEYKSLANYIQPECDDFIKQHSVGHYKKQIVRALLKCLRIADKPLGSSILSESALFNYISSIDEEFYYDLKRKLACWCLSIHKKQKVLNEIINYVESDFSDFFCIIKNSELDSFLYNAPSHLALNNQPHKSNTYTHSNNNHQIDIEICTIHSAKGETHTATLYLETFYYNYDISKIIEYLKGNYNPPNQKHLRQYLRMAYVGMSRPSHLLCVAVHKNHLIGHDKELRAAGWHVDSNLA